VDDDDIREGLRAGDVDRAFRLLGDRYRAPVFRTCYAVLQNRAIAEEALQETFAKAFRKRRRLAAADSLKAYLLRIARNTALDVQRQAQRRRGLDRHHHDGEVGVTAAASPGLEPAEATALIDGLDALEPTTRTALLLHHWEERSWQEIADVVGLPVDTIRMRAARVLRDLLACLKGKGVAP
jgi:RNA polymerase sigma-70 factor (ECF subfamily)